MAKISVVDLYKVVLDYGKTIQTDVSKIGATFDTGVNTRVSYVGAALDGTHGAVTASKPADLLLTAKNCSVQTEESSFSMATSTLLRFTPKTIMEGATTLYGVYRVSPVSDPGYTLYYITKAIYFLPATAVYYETDLGTSIYSVDRSDSLFIPFSTTDTTEWGEPANIINPSKANGILQGTINGGDPHIQMTAASCNFNYVIMPGDVVKVCIKSDPSIGDRLQVFFMTDGSSTPLPNISTVIADYTPNGEWQTITLRMLDNLVGKQITGLRLDPIGNNEAFQSEGPYQCAWIYVGPDMDLDMGDAFTFTTNSPCTRGQVVTFLYRALSEA